MMGANSSYSQHKIVKIQQNVNYGFVMKEFFFFFFWGGRVEAGVHACVRACICQPACLFACLSARSVAQHQSASLFSDKDILRPHTTQKYPTCRHKPFYSFLRQQISESLLPPRARETVVFSLPIKVHLDVLAAEIREYKVLRREVLTDDVQQKSEYIQQESDSTRF